MCHETLFDELKASAYRPRCKVEHSVAFKISQKAFAAGAPPQTLLGELTTCPRPSNQLGRGHRSPYPTFARHSEPHFGGGGGEHCPKICLSRTAPGNSNICTS